MDQRRANVAAEAIPALMPLLKVGAKYYLEERQLSKRTEAQKEVVEAESSAEQRRPSPRTATSPDYDTATAEQPSPQTAPQAPQDISPKLESMASEETCGTCAAALRGLKSASAEKQRTGLDEYQDLKKVMETADEPDEIKEFLGGTDVLRNAIEASI